MVAYPKERERSTGTIHPLAGPARDQAGGDDALNMAQWFRP